MSGTTAPRDEAARRRAVTETGANVVVSAGAGTGKTSLIVERLLVTIGGGLAPLHAIAAITFTEKAAGELRFRLADGLEELARLAEGNDADAVTTPAARALAHLTIDRATIASRARAAALRLDRATVTTIHGFCAEILRSHPIEAGLPPGFQVDRGPASTRAAREEWERFLEEELGPGATREALWARALTALTPSDLGKLGRGLARGAIPAAVLADAYRPADFESTLGAAAARLAGELTAARDATKGLTPAPRQWVDEAIGVLTHVARGDLEAARRGLDASERVSDKALKAESKNVDRTEAKRIETPARAARRLIRAIEDLDEPAVSAAIEAVLPYARRLRDRLYRAGLVDFDTLLVATRDLLRDHAHVREALKARFTSILLDEFQDTDPLQYEVVFFLAEETGSARLAPGRLFIVGDAKQSIYRFRGADYAAYRRAVARVREQGGVELTLSANFRSVPGVLAPVGALFEPPTTRAWTPSPYLPEYEPITAERSDREQPAVEVWTTPASAGAASARRVAEGRAIAAEIAKLAADGTPYGDVLVLLRSFSNVPLYLRELREAGIPFVASGGRTFYERTEIVQALGVLRAIADPTDPIARLAYLRSPAGGVPDQELAREADGNASATTTPALHAAVVRLAALRAEVEPLPVDVAARHVLERTGLFALNAVGFEGAQRVANLDKLATDASEFARDGRLTLLELLDALADRPRGEEEGDSPLADETTDAVRVMTIHKAKGLEAQVVILADAAAGRGHFPERDWKIGIARDAGHERITLAGPKFVNTAFAIGKIENQRHEEAEDIRLLYVALTRARERLIVLTGATRGPTPWMDALAAWGYDPRSQPADGTALHGGSVRFRMIDAPQPRSRTVTGVPPGAPEAVARYEGALRASALQAVAFRSPSAAASVVSAAPDGGADAARARAVGVAVHETLSGIATGPPHPDVVAAEASALLERFAGSPLAARLASVEVLGREIPILLKEDDRALWRGSIDLLYRDADGTLVVADYKSDVDLESAAERHREQLRVYVEAVRRVMPEDRVRAELWMLRHAAIVEVPA